MNPANFHLLINHFPIVGGILATVLMFSGIVIKNETVKRTAYFLFVFAGITVVFTFLSGEGAEEIIEKIKGIDENLIEKHEESAKFALWSTIISGIISLIGLFLSFKSSRLSGIFSFVVLLVSFISIFFSWKAGFTGGKIRHTDASNTQSTIEDHTDETHHH
ncbi:MAG: hypothetical protein IT243_10900 [Bacteroidia bacterium]|nr:hypothetical protein [Bacteroidia bacterium]